MRPLFVFRQLNDFKVAKLLAVDGEAHQCAHLVPALQSRCAGIDVEAMERAVVEHLEDVGMSRDEKLRRANKHLSDDASVVVARIAADVLHQDIGILTFEAQRCWEHAAKVAAVGVATHRAKRLHRFKAFGQFRRPDVAGVPNFVAVLEIRLIAVVPIAVSVREQSDSFHGHLLSAVSFLMAKSLMSSAVASMPNTEELMQRW